MSYEQMLSDNFGLLLYTLLLIKLEYFLFTPIYGIILTMIYS